MQTSLSVLQEIFQRGSTLELFWISISAAQQRGLCSHLCPCAAAGCVLPDTWELKQLCASLRAALSFLLDHGGCEQGINAI